MLQNHRADRKANCTQSYTDNRYTQPMHMSYPNGVSSFNKFVSNRPAYVNPYELNKKKNELGPVSLPSYEDNHTYEAQPTLNGTNLQQSLSLTSDMYEQKFPGGMRNINIESALQQHEYDPYRTGRGQRQLTEQTFNRFSYLPYNPQNPNNLVWSDNMPRGGHATRKTENEDEN